MMRSVLCESCSCLSYCKNHQAHQNLHLSLSPPQASLPSFLTAPPASPHITQGGIEVQIFYSELFPLTCDKRSGQDRGKLTMRVCSVKPAVARMYCAVGNENTRKKLDCGHIPGNN